MDRYIDIHLLPDPEFTPPLLMSALFSKLHRALVDHGRGDIGVSFPDVDSKHVRLGECLRLHGSGDALGLLMDLDWLQGMRDHTRLTPARPVPESASHRMVHRVQAKSSPARLRRRLMKRQGIDESAAADAIPDDAAERLQLPYVTLSSHSTKQRFRLFIEHAPVQASPVAGSFSQYGLSSTATVPWF